MASSSGSSPACPRPGFDARWRRLAAALTLALPLAAVADPLPDYVRTALAHFSPNPPAGWGYTLTTTRDDHRMVERYDPSRPPGGQWTLLQWLGRPPTVNETEKYARSRPQGGSGGTQASFTREDIEPGSLQLVREDAEWADFAGEFRTAATSSDKMLGHLRIRLTVHKSPAYVGKYRLELKEPYSPVLTLRMEELMVEATFAAPTATTPSLPAAQTSRFRGRFLVFPKTESLVLIYSDFTTPPTELSR